MEYDYKTLENKLLSLPVDLQRAMVSVELVKKIKQISDKYGLNVEQMGYLEEVISHTILGLSPMKNLRFQIEKNLNVSSNISLEINKDINNIIFLPIRSSLQKIQGQRENMVEQSNSRPQQPNIIPKPPQNQTVYQDRTRPIQPQNNISQPEPIKPLARPNPFSNPVPSPNPSPIQPKTVEQAGQFNVVKNNYNPYPETNTDKDAVLREIENSEISMVDHLLTAPSISQERVEIKKPIAPTPPVPKIKVQVDDMPYDSDPYREPIQ